jgi:hypothetical protein
MLRQEHRAAAGRNSEKFYLKRPSRVNLLGEFKGRFKLGKFKNSEKFHLKPPYGLNLLGK